MGKYIVVRSPDIANFERLVSDKIGEGYRPVGGLVMSSDNLHATVYCQAMMK